MPPKIQSSSADLTSAEHENHQLKSAEKVNKETERIPPLRLDTNMKDRIQVEKDIEQRLFMRERVMKMSYDKVKSYIQETKECVKQQHTIFAIVEGQNEMNYVLQKYVDECMPLMQYNQEIIPDEGKEAVERNIRQLHEVIKEYNDVNVIVRQLKLDDRKLSKRMERYVRYENDNREERASTMNSAIIRLPNIQLQKFNENKVSIDSWFEYHLKIRDLTNEIERLFFLKVHVEDNASKILNNIPNTFQGSWTQSSFYEIPSRIHVNKHKFTPKYH